MSDSFELARSFDYLTVREVECIKAIVHYLPSGSTVVNIGSGAGTSTLAVLEERTDITLYDVDLNLSQASDQYQKAGVEGDPRLRRIEGNSRGVPWNGTQIDYIFIDGDHSDEGIRGDLAAWLPRMKPGGYVLLHDYWPYPPDHKQAGIDWWPDVRRVAEEVLKDCKVIMDTDRIRVYQV